MFWSTEDLSIGSDASPLHAGVRGTESEDLASGAPWCTSDLADVHSRLRDLEAERNFAAEKLLHEQSDQTRADEHLLDDAKSIRVYPGDGMERQSANQSEFAETGEGTSFKLTDDGRAIEGT